ncbi:MAG: hypothetical protein H7070_06695, partial [Saprospiraceae bacterium]|nr:hypothetical protein [Pyrinomonadaceae bacterium]
QWIFSGETLKHAYKDILDEKEASWYKPLGEYSDWEKLPTLNGTTNRSFHQLLKTLDVSIRYVTRTPIMTTGKSYPALRKMVIRPTFAAMLGIRVLDDLLLDRIAVIIEKKK